MNQEQSNSNSINSCSPPRASREGRCHHRFVNGTRCRLLASNPESLFCRLHASLPEHEHAPLDLSTALTGGLAEFTSAIPINTFLSRLLHLQAEDRIPPRRAAVMAYTCNLILRTLPAIDKELHPENGQDESCVFDFTDFPHPDRSQRPSSDHSVAIPLGPGGDCSRSNAPS